MCNYICFAKLFEFLHELGAPSMRMAFGQPKELKMQASSSVIFAMLFADNYLSHA